MTNSIQRKTRSNRCVYGNNYNTSLISLSIQSADRNNLPEREVVSGVLGVKASQHESFPQVLVKRRGVTATARGGAGTS